jgi:glycosyltransferase involved in cell wall biosynthesis
MPFLTIAIPTYNRSRNLLALLEAIHMQLDKNKLPTDIEVLVCDNHSTDDTSHQVRNFIRQNASNVIRYIRNKTNIGAIKNVANLVLEAKGRYILICGDDDLISPAALANAICIVRNNPDTKVFLFRAKNAPTYRHEEEFVSFNTARDEYFYTIGNLGLFIAEVKGMKHALTANEDRICMTCWPQTEMLFLCMAETNRNHCLYISNLAICDYPNHMANSIYTGYYLYETTFYGLYRVAKHIEAYLGEPFVVSAMQCTHFFAAHSSANMHRQLYLHATYRDSETEIEDFRNTVLDSLNNITHEKIAPVARQTFRMLNRFPFRRKVVVTLRWLQENRRQQRMAIWQGFKAVVGYLRDVFLPLGILYALHQERKLQRVFLHDKSRKIALKKSHYRRSDLSPKK